MSFKLPDAGSLGLVGDAPTLIQKGWNLLIEVAGVIFLILLLVGGIQYLTSLGNADATQKALKTLTNAVFGLILVLLAWPIGTFVLGAFGLGGFSNPIGGGGGQQPGILGSGGGQQPGIPGSGGGQQSGAPGNGGGQPTEGQETVSITVHNPNGQPVSNTTLILKPQDQESSRPITTTTNNNGVAIFSDVPPGDYELQDSKGRFLANIKVQAQQPTQQTIIIDNLVQVQITITDNKTLKGVPNYTFRIYLGSGDGRLLTTATTDSNGQASVKLPANQNVNITSNFSSATLQNFTVPSDNGRNITVFISQAAQPGQTLALHYRFVDSNGNFAQGKSVTILSVGDPNTSSNDERLVTTTVPSDGLVTVTGLKPGDRLLVEYKGQRICGVTVPNQNAAQASCTLPD